MLPLRDLNPTRRVPVVTYLLIAANVLVFIWLFLQPEAALRGLFSRLAVVPANITQSPLAVDNMLDLFRSMFFHGGWAHLLSNMLYLWLFGDNIEDRMGVVLYLVLYFFSGIAATLAQLVIDPGSTIPMIGASGAIAGVLGGYLVMFPGVRVQGIIPLGWFARRVTWPAWIVLGMWFVMQLLNGFISLGVQTAATGGVAFFAHIGGFVAGLVLSWIFMKLVPQPPPDHRREVLYKRARRYRY